MRPVNKTGSTSAAPRTMVVQMPDGSDADGMFLAQDVSRRSSGAFRWKTYPQAPAAGKRYGLPDCCPAHQRTHLPGLRRPWKSRGSANTPGCAPETAANVTPEHAPGRAPQPRQAATHTVPWHRFPSAMRPWTAQHDGLQRDNLTHHGTNENGPLTREFPANGPSLQVVAGVGFEPT